MIGKNFVTLKQLLNITTQENKYAIKKYNAQLQNKITLELPFKTPFNSFL